MSESNGFSNKVKACLPIVTIVAVSVLEAIALFMGINGALLSSSIGIIAGLGGLSSGYVLAKRNGKTVTVIEEPEPEDTEEGD